jgi:signal transduction histidine kinase/FixJ family two-component response regulator
MTNKSVNIVYVEENIGDADVLEKLLKSAVTIESFKVCAKLNDVIESVAKSSCDIIIMEISQVDSLIMENLKKTIDELDNRIPVVVISEHNDFSVAMTTIKHGAQDYIAKGDLNKTLLGKTVYHAIERHKVQSDLMKNQKALLLAKDRLNKAEEMAYLGSWDIDIETDEIILSMGMIKLLSLPQETRVIDFGEFVKFIHPEDKGAFIRSLVAARNEGVPIDEEVRMLKNKDEITTISRAEAILNEKGEPVKIYGVSLNITELKETEAVREQFTQELAQKVKERTSELEKTRIRLEKSLSTEKELGELKSRFVSTASHQFRTPLTVIQSNLSLLELQIDQVNESFRPKIETISKRIKKEITRMTGLMNDVLILGKIGVGGVIPVFTDVDVVQICQQVLDKFNQIQEDNRTATLEVAGTKKSIGLDKNLFEHSVSNILSNAFKYSEGKPSPIIRINFTKRRVKVIIEDFGMGIPTKELDMLFDPFFRASNALDIPGTGLGTAIVKEYTEANNGTVNIESDKEKGCVVTLDFLVYDAVTLSQNQ